MITSNYHIHSNFCDGHNSLEEMAEEAYRRGLKSIGFSSHFAIEYDDDYAIDKENLSAYKKEIEELKKKYSGKMDIYYSFEFDYYMGDDDITELAKEYLKDVDYVLMSIHTMGLMPDGQMGIIDYLPEVFKRGVEEIYSSPEEFVKTYYKKIADMAEKYRPDIIGHIDLIKKNNFDVFDEEADYYKQAVRDCLDRIERTDSIIEINTGGVYRYGERCLYPSEFILEEIYKRGIPVTVNGDTHYADGIDFLYEKVENLLKSIGFNSIKVFNGTSWEDFPI